MTGAKWFCSDTFVWNLFDAEIFIVGGFLALRRLCAKKILRRSVSARVLAWTLIHNYLSHEKARDSSIFSRFLKFLYRFRSIFFFVAKFMVLVRTVRVIPGIDVPEVVQKQFPSIVNCFPTHFDLYHFYVLGNAISLEGDNLVTFRFVSHYLPNTWNKWMKIGVTNDECIKVWCWKIQRPSTSG